MLPRSCGSAIERLINLIFRLGLRAVSSLTRDVEQPDDAFAKPLSGAPDDVFDFVHPEMLVRQGRALSAPGCCLAEKLRNEILIVSS